MSHPFYDFLPQQWHEQKRDRRVFRYGLVLVGIVVITTFSAFATTMTHWRTVFQTQQSVTAKWDDARQRVQGYLTSERTLKNKLDEAKKVSSLLDIVPKSLLLAELTSVLPKGAFLISIRIDTRIMPGSKDPAIAVDKISISGEAPDDPTVSLFVEGLMKSRYFQNIALQYSQQKQISGSRNFAINMEVRDDFANNYTEVELCVSH